MYNIIYQHFWKGYKMQPKTICKGELYIKGKSGDGAKTGEV